MKAANDHNLYVRRNGVEVYVRRNGVTYWAFAGAASHADPMAEARRLRDRFIAIAGPKKRMRFATKARSNTGVAGIREETVWVKSHPYPCFYATWVDGNGRARRKQFVYGGIRTRAQALALAVAARNEAMGTAGGKVGEWVSERGNRANRTDGVNGLLRSLGLAEEVGS